MVAVKCCKCFRNTNKFRCCSCGHSICTSCKEQTRKLPVRKLVSDEDLLFLLEVFERSGQSLSYRAKVYRVEAMHRGLIKKEAK